MTAVRNPIIELVDINEELTKLWDKEQGQNKIRASLFNLIIYLQKDERVDYFEQLIKTVVSKFPCRVIVIIDDASSSEPYLRTQVGAETIHEGETQIFCEVIHVSAAGSLTERVPFIILPLLLPDLPIYLLWSRDPSGENAILPHLEPLAHRIIFDTESTKDLQSYSKAVLSLMHRFHCDVSDLNWSAFSGWRALFRQVFDTPDSLLSLVQSHTIRIYYNKNPSQYYLHTENKAAYLQAWLASRLNWTFQNIEINEGNIRLTYKKTMNEVAILLIPQDFSDLNAGAIGSIEIESEKNQGHYSFKRVSQGRQVNVQYSDKERCDLPTCSYLAGITEGQEIIKEIFYPSTGKHYESMLNAISGIPWGKG